MKPSKVRSILDKRISEAASRRYDYCVDGTKNFVRNRKLPLKKMVTGIIGMGAGNLSNEVLKLTNYSIDGVRKTFSNRS